MSSVARYLDTFFFYLFILSGENKTEQFISLDFLFRFSITVRIRLNR